MLVFLFGKDSFRSYEKLKDIIQRYQEKYPETLSFRQVNLLGQDFLSLKNLLEASSLFEEKKLIIFRDAFVLKSEEQKKLVELLKEGKIAKEENSIIVFYEKDDVDQRTSLFKFLKEKAKTQKFSSLNRLQAKNWTEKMIDDYFPELKMSDSAIAFLADNLGSDLWRIYQELNKLSDYQKSVKKPVIAGEDIKELVAFPVETDIFKTIDAVAQKNKKAALRALAYHFKNLEPELKILAMFEYQFRSLVRIRSLMDEGDDYYAIGRKTKIHPFALRKMYYLAHNFSMDDLKKIYDQLFDLDLGFKTGKIKDKQIALEMFVAELCSK